MMRRLFGFLLYLKPFYASKPAGYLDVPPRSVSNLAVILKVFFSIFDKILIRKELYFFSEIGKKAKWGRR